MTLRFTHLIGKWHMPDRLPALRGVDRFITFTVQESQGRYFDCPLIVDGREEPSRKHYITEELTDRALDFLNRKRANPFCLYLSRKAVHHRFLACYQFLVGLSLDGPQEVHDRYRRSAGGAGSFDRVMAAAELLASEGVAFNILSVVSRAGQDRGAEIYRFFRSRGFDHLHFIPCLETDPATGRIADFSVTPEGLTRFFSEVFDLQRAEGLMTVSERNRDAFLRLRLEGKAGICTLDRACGDYLVVKHKGDIFPCDFFVEEAWRLGNLDDGRLADFFKHPLMQRFREARGLASPECMACTLGRWCRGGCLKDRLPHRASAAGKSHFCEAIKKLYAITWPSLEAAVRQIDPARPAAMPPNRTAPAGRNAPCPCGSGLKYKRCCLPKG